MDILIARQPIYDVSLKVFAYELLYRSNKKINAYTETDGDAATISVIMGAFLNIGIETVTNKNPGFINFTENLLKSDVIKMLPAEYLGIEILESVEPTDEIINVCGELKNNGYKIILDDYSYNESTKRFIQYADIIKMDFMNSADEELQLIVNEYKKTGIKFVAEKIETKEDFIKAKAYGYDYFQGYYFSKPSLVQNKSILPLKVNALRALEMLQEDDCDIKKIAAIISYDPGMMYRLLKLANSVVYGGRTDVTRADVAIMRIGLKDLRTWMLFILLHDVNGDKPNELIKQSMFRAKAAEEICVKKNLGRDMSGFSLLGLFSLMNVIMDAPFEEIIAQVNISENVAAALLKAGDDPYGAVIRVIRAYDDGEWEEAEAAGNLIGLSLEEYKEIYLKSMQWCDNKYNSILI